MWLQGRHCWLSRIRAWGGGAPAGRRLGTALVHAPSCPQPRQGLPKHPSALPEGKIPVVDGGLEYFVEPDKGKVGPLCKKIIKNFKVTAEH